jgi:hypothetical protein
MLFIKKPSSSILITFFIVITASFWLPDASAHFALAPKLAIQPSELESPQAVLMKVGNITATRGEFSDYLQRITALDTRYDRIQPNFYSHFSLVRGVALFYPDNVHTYIDKIALVKQQPPFYKLAVNSWFEKQAEMFTRILYYKRRASETKLINSNDIKAVMDFYAASAKTAFIEELIVLGSMPPTLQGLADFSSKLSSEQRRKLATGAANDTELTPPDEQQKMRQRWITFRRDVLSHTTQTSHCDTFQSLSVPQDTVLISVNQHKVSLGDFFAIFGKPQNDKQWNAVKRVNCSRLALFYAMGDLAEKLNIVPERVREKIQISQQLYLAGVQITKELAPLVINNQRSPNDLRLVQELMAFPQVVDLQKHVIQATNQLAAKHELSFLDKEYLASVPWRLERKLAPQHSIHL